MKNGPLFISWAPYCSRSDGIARRLGGESHMVYSSGWGSNIFTVAFKYLSQTIKTLWLLFRKRPDVVFVMAPPVIACIPVWLYCALCGKSFVIDAHTGAFLHPRWTRLQWIQRFFSRRARTTIVTNTFLQDRVHSWGAHATIITDVPVYFAEPAPVELVGECNMTLVSSFCDDEPLEEFLAAAGSCPDVQFHVTGNTQKLSRQVLDSAPTNVRFTGFLSDSEYVGLVQASDAVIALTNRDHTMQRAGYEAIYLGRPVVTSDFGCLREAFPLGTVHVPPTAEGIAGGVRQMRLECDRYRQEAEELRARKLDRWAEVADELRSLLSITNGTTCDPVASVPTPE
ncbi:glycosyltransferase [Maioricimonas rarisocia]|nr:glycosyltransferase [Maioricimonas rarisocia]